MLQLLLRLLCDNCFAVDNRDDDVERKAEEAETNSAIARSSCNGLLAERALRPISLLRSQATGQYKRKPSSCACKLHLVILEPGT